MRAVDRQVVVVTGATTGIGREIVRGLAARGATVVLHGRNHERVATARAEIDGHDVTWQVNFLATFLLTWLLGDLLAAGGGARVVNMSSGVQASGRVDLEQPDEPRTADPYTQSKIALVMHAVELGQRWRDRQVDVNACCPGWIATQMGGRGGAPVSRGADTPLWLLADPELDGVTGELFASRRRVARNPQADDPEARRRLWSLAAGAVGIS